MEHRDAVDTLATERYLLDEMSEAERAEFEAHFFECGECADDVRAAAVMRDGIRQGLLAPHARRDRPSPSRAPRMSVLLPWAVAATLAIVVVYQARAPRRGSANTIVALTTTTLRPATRGREQVVAAGAAAALAIDVGGLVSAPTLHYTLDTSDGAHVADGVVAGPAPGAPLLLLLPSNSVKPSQHYVLRLQDPRNNALTPEEYRFTVGQS